MRRRGTVRHWTPGRNHGWAVGPDGGKVVVLLRDCPECRPIPVGEIIEFDRAYDGLGRVRAINIVRSGGRTRIKTDVQFIRHEDPS